MSEFEGIGALRHVRHFDGGSGGNLSVGCDATRNDVEPEVDLIKVCRLVRRREQRGVHRTWLLNPSLPRLTEQEVAGLDVY